MFVMAKHRIIAEFKFTFSLSLLTFKSHTVQLTILLIHSSFFSLYYQSNVCPPETLLQLALSILHPQSGLSRDGLTTGTLYIAETRWAGQRQSYNWSSVFCTNKMGLAEKVLQLALCILHKQAGLGRDSLTAGTLYFAQTS